MLTRYAHDTQLHTANFPFAPLRTTAGAPAVVRGFLTVTRQVGAEAPGLPQRLTALLNERAASGPAWRWWDEELVLKTAMDYGIDPQVIRSFNTSSHSWVDDFLAGLSGRADDMAIFHGLRKVVRDLAGAGHAILVGSGSAYMTRDLIGRVHVNLVAPLDHRVKKIAARLGLSPSAALRYVRRMDRLHGVFFRRVFPRAPRPSEMFDIALNTADLDVERLARAIADVVPAATMVAGAK